MKNRTRLQVDVHEFLKGLSWHSLPDAATSLVERHLERSKLRRKQIIAHVNKLMAQESSNILEQLPPLKVDQVSSRESVGRTPRLHARTRPLTVDVRQVDQPSSHVWRDAEVSAIVTEEAAEAHGLQWLHESEGSTTTLQSFELQHGYSRRENHVEEIFFVRVPVDGVEKDMLSAQQEGKRGEEPGQVDPAGNGREPDDGEQQEDLLNWVPSNVGSRASKNGRLVPYTLTDNGSGLGDFAAQSYAAIRAVIAAYFPLRGGQVKQTFSEDEGMQEAYIATVLASREKRIALASSTEAAWQSTSLPPPSSSEPPLRAPDESTTQAHEAPEQLQGDSGASDGAGGPPNDPKVPDTKEQHVCGSNFVQYIKQVAKWATGNDGQHACLVGLLSSNQGGLGVLTECCALLLDALRKEVQGGEQADGERIVAQEPSGGNKAGEEGHAEEKLPADRQRPLKVCHFIRTIEASAREITPHVLGQLRGVPPYSECDGDESGWGNELDDLPRMVLTEAQKQACDVVCVIHGLASGERLRLITGVARACQAFKPETNVPSLKIVLSDDSAAAKQDLLLLPCVTQLPEPPLLEVRIRRVMVLLCITLTLHINVA
jgi:hypothetical protein